MEYHQLGILAQDRGDYEQAELRYRQSLEIFERLGDQSGIAMSNHELGNLEYLRGRYVEAEHYYRQSLQITERLDDQSGMAKGYHQLGILTQDRGDYVEAEHRYQQSLQIFERLADQRWMTACWSSLGLLAAERRRYDEAVDWSVRAFLSGLKMQIPQTNVDARALVALRKKMGSETFLGVVSTILDESELTEIQAVLDSLPDDDSGESEAE